jgi:hypothetical protein
MTGLDRVRQALFNTTAPRYESPIMPAFGLPGRVARRVIGLDCAPAMPPLARRIGRRHHASNVVFRQGHMHRIITANE